MSIFVCAMNERDKDRETVVYVVFFFRFIFTQERARCSTFSDWGQWTQPVRSPRFRLFASVHRSVSLTRHTFGYVVFSTSCMPFARCTAIHFHNAIEIMVLFFYTMRRIELSEFLPHAQPFFPFFEPLWVTAFYILVYSKRHQTAVLKIKNLRVLQQKKHTNSRQQSRYYNVWRYIYRWDNSDIYNQWILC